MWVFLKYAKRWVGNYRSQQCLDTRSELSSRSKSVSAPATYDSQLFHKSPPLAWRLRVKQVNKFVLLPSTERRTLYIWFPVQNIVLRNESTQDLPFWRHLEYAIRHMSLQPRTQGLCPGSKWQRYVGPGYDVGVTHSRYNNTASGVFSQDSTGFVIMHMRARFIASWFWQQAELYKVVFWSNLSREILSFYRC